MSKAKRPEVGGIGAEDFAQWKHHPVTKVLHQFLDDYRAALRRDHLERWESGQENEAIERQAQGRVNTAGEIKDLSFDDLLKFYSENEPAAADETPAE